MTHHEAVTEEIQEQAAMFSLGLLGTEEAVQFESHTRECPVCAAELRACNEVVAEVALTAPEAAPPPHLRDELVRRAASPAVVVRAGDGVWQSPFPGIEVKKLFFDANTLNTTWLVRMAAGGVYPSHRHAGLEHLYVLEGDVIFGDHTLHPGDYEVRGPDTHHSSATTGQGCLLLVINNQRDVV
jgi:anti-sigma factor ChrR (cupin superfamily)